jgi:acyl dehydratase
MPLNPALVGRRTRRFRSVADARWLMAYAAALGDTQGCYFDTTGTIVAHPLFPVCPEWPVVLDGRNVEGYSTLSREEAARGVHATHDLEIHRPIEAGMELFTTATVVAVESRKPGAYQLTKLETTLEDGTPIATTWQGSLFRGVGVSGPDRVAEQGPPLPDVAAMARVDRVYELEVAAGAAHVYTECARIWNPIHTDRAVAHAAGLPDIILHGTATLALAVSAIVRHELGDEPRRVRRIAGRFGAMVPMPTTLRLHLERRTPDAVAFTVRTADDGAAIREGLISFAP